MKQLLDTHAILYLLGGRLAEPLPPAEYFVSVITEIELLSYPSIGPAEEKKIRAFLADVTMVELTPAIRRAAVRLRREHELKLPDAIIAATALTLEAEVLTNDRKLLNVPGLSGQPVKLKDE